MKMISIPSALLLGSVLMLTAPAAAAAADTRCYELRTYHAAPGKMEALHQRFRDHTLRLFAKHGMKNLGYWVRLNKEGQREEVLTFLLSYPSREAREASWKAFMADPEWQAAHKASEANGPLVQKAENPFLAATDYSPEIRAEKTGAKRIFELRTYKAAPDRLDALNARFRNHTVKLFGKHGMTNVGYWTPTEEKDGSRDTLIYILAHGSRDAAAASFKAFGQDPEWQAARKDSEAKAGGSLTAPGGVRSVFMEATDYSPMQ